MLVKDVEKPLMNKCVNLCLISTLMIVMVALGIFLIYKIYRDDIKMAKMEYEFRLNQEDNNTIEMYMDKRHEKLITHPSHWSNHDEAELMLLKKEFEKIKHERAKKMNNSPTNSDER